MKLIKILVASLVFIGTILYCILARENVYTKLLTVVGGVSLGLAVLRFEGTEGIGLPPWLQFLLGTFAIFTAVLATNWTTFSPSDLSKWFITSVVILIYKDGFLWAWSHLARKEISQS